MNKNLFKKCILLITYTVLLVALIVKIDLVLGFVSTVLKLLTPIFIGLALAFILNRPYNFFERIFESVFKKRKIFVKPLALIIVYLLLFGVLSTIVTFLIPQLVDSVNTFYNSVGRYSEKLNNIIGNLSGYINGINFSAFIQDITNISSNLFKGLFSNVINFTANAVGGFINIVLGVILSIYILSDKKRLRRQFDELFAAYLPPKFYEKVKHILSMANEIFSQFVTGQFIEAIILGALCFIGMMIFGFDYPLLISVIIAVTSIIPVAGPIIGAIPAVFILLMAEPLQALWFIVFLIILQQLEGNLIYPRVVGDKIGLPALWVLIAIIVGGGLAGILGILLIVPTTSLIYQLVKKDVNQKSLFYGG